MVKLTALSFLLILAIVPGNALLSSAKSSTAPPSCCAALGAKGPCGTRGCGGGPCKGDTKTCGTKGSCKLGTCVAPLDSALVRDCGNRECSGNKCAGKYETCASPGSCPAGSCVAKETGLAALSQGQAVACCCCSKQ